MSDTKKQIVVTCERMSSSPDAIAHTPDGKTIFVRGALPEERASIIIDAEKTSYIHAHVTEIIEASLNRVEPLCPASDLLSTCPWGCWAYQAQVQQKRKNICDALTRIGHMDPDRAEALTEQPLQPEKTWHYRNKIELEVLHDSSDIKIGVFEIGSRNFIEVTDTALLNSPHKNLIKGIVGSLRFLHGRTRLEIDRIELRTSARTESLEIALWGPPAAFPRHQAAKILIDATGATSVVRVLQKGTAKARKVVGVECLGGKGYFTEVLCERHMKVSAPSFFQVHTQAAEILVNTVIDLALEVPHEYICDLYCGVGTFTLPLSSIARKVTALESFGCSVKDLERNLKSACTNNVEVICGDAAREFPKNDYDLILVDPPRAGLFKEVARKLISSLPKNIIYVSCNPATLARDIFRLEESNKYRAVRIIPVDLFPQTYHVETVVFMSRVGA